MRVYTLAGYMRSGIKPHVFDARDYALHKTFPLMSATQPAVLLPRIYDYDAGFPIPDQDQADTRFNPILPNMPQGCTGEATASVCSDQDKVLYDPYYTYCRTCDIEGHGYDQPCDMRNSMNSLTIYGLRKDGETQVQAEARKRGAYYSIDKAEGYDWFDSFRIALRDNGKSISVGTPWFSEWQNPVQNGLLTSQFIYDGYPTHYEWHDTKVSGETLIDGEPILIVYSWQGPNIGINGRLYWDRTTFNKAFDIYGTIGLTPGPAVTPGDIQYVTADIWQLIGVYLNRILAALNLPQKTIYA